MRRSREILTFAFLWRLVVSGGGAGAVPLPLPVPVLVPAAGLVLVPCSLRHCNHVSEGSKPQYMACTNQGTEGSNAHRLIRVSNQCLWRC